MEYLSPNVLVPEGQPISHGGQFTMIRGHSFWGVCTTVTYRVRRPPSGEEFIRNLVAVCRENLVVGLIVVKLTNRRGTTKKVFRRSPLFVRRRNFRSCFAAYNVSILMDGEVDIELVEIERYENYDVVRHIVRCDFFENIKVNPVVLPISSTAQDLVRQVKLWLPNPKRTITATEFVRGLLMTGLVEDLRTFMHVCPQLVSGLKDLFNEHYPAFHPNLFMRTDENQWIFTDFSIELFAPTAEERSGHRLECKVFGIASSAVDCKFDPRKLALSLVLRLPDPMIFLERDQQGNVQRHKGRCTILIARKASFRLTLLVQVLVLHRKLKEARKRIVARSHELFKPGGAGYLALVEKYSVQNGPLKSSGVDIQRKRTAEWNHELYKPGGKEYLALVEKYKMIETGPIVSHDEADPSDDCE